MKVPSTNNCAQSLLKHRYFGWLRYLKCIKIKASSLRLADLDYGAAMHCEPLTKGKNKGKWNELLQNAAPGLHRLRI